MTVERQAPEPHAPSRDSPAHFGGDQADDRLDDLVEGHGGGVHLDGVGGLAQRRDGARGVAPVALDQGGEHLAVVDVVPGLAQLCGAARRPNLRARRQEDLDGRVREARWCRCRGPP